MTDKTLEEIIKSYGATEKDLMGERFYQTHDGHGSSCDKRMLLDLMALAKQAGRDEAKTNKKIQTLGLNQEGIFVTLLENPCSRGHKSALKFLDNGNVACLACEATKPKERNKLVIAELKKLCSELNQEWYENHQFLKQEKEKLVALEADLRSSKATIGCLSKEKDALEAEVTRKNRKIEIQKAQLKFMGCPCDLTEFGNEHLHKSEENACLRERIAVLGQLETKLRDALEKIVDGEASVYDCQMIAKKALEESK